MSESAKYLQIIIDSRKKRLEELEAKITNSENRLYDQEARRLKLVKEIKGLEDTLHGSINRVQA